MGKIGEKFLAGTQYIDTVVCISLETLSIASQPSVAVGWVKIKVWSMPHLKGLTANFKLM